VFVHLQDVCFEDLRLARIKLEKYVWLISDLGLQRGPAKNSVQGLSFFPYQLSKVIWKTNYLNANFN
jgi:hypothetical protein